MRKAPKTIVYCCPAALDNCIGMFSMKSSHHHRSIPSERSWVQFSLVSPLNTARRESQIVAPKKEYSGGIERRRKSS